SENDIKAAKAAGCLSVGLSYGYNYGESIALSEPDLVLHQFTGLLPALGIDR
ncbi:MAG: phosphoglycolate phosphatase, partial [Plesiomonas shigelloides]